MNTMDIWEDFTFVMKQNEPRNLIWAGEEF